MLKATKLIPQASAVSKGGQPSIMAGLESIVSPQRVRQAMRATESRPSAWFAQVLDLSDVPPPAFKSGNNQLNIKQRIADRKHKNFGAGLPASASLLPGGIFTSEIAECLGTGRQYCTVWKNIIFRSLMKFSWVPSSSLNFPHSFLIRFLCRNFPLPATQYYGQVFWGSPCQCKQRANKCAVCSFFMHLNFCSPIIRHWRPPAPKRGSGCSRTSVTI
jgi:hypothetical protein